MKGTATLALCLQKIHVNEWKIMWLCHMSLFLALCDWGVCVSLSQVRAWWEWMFFTVETRGNFGLKPWCWDGGEDEVISEQESSLNINLRGFHKSNWCGGIVFFYTAQVMTSHVTRYSGAQWFSVGDPWNFSSTLCHCVRRAKHCRR